MTHKFAVFTFAALAFASVLFVSGVLPSDGQQPEQSTANKEKIAALKDAFDNGLLTQQEYDTKLRALNAPAEAPYSGAHIATKSAGIFDPTLGGMLFTSFTIPSDWVFQGGMTQGTGCNVTNYPFFRANSPDGLTGTKLFPPAEFAWADNPALMPGPRSGCIARVGEINAADYMKYMIGQMQAEFVKDVTGPTQLEKFRRQITPFDPQRPGKLRITSADLATNLVRFNINSISEMEEIDVYVTCSEQPQRPRGSIYGCSVRVNTTWAPEGKLLATVQMLQSIAKETDNPAWMQAWAQRNNAQWAAIRAQNAANTVAYYSALNNQIISSGEAFRNQMNNQFRVHEQQMAVAQRGSDMNLQQQQQHWDAQQRHTDDLVDSVLNQQKRYDPTTGQIYKSDSAYTYNWVSADGKQYYPTNDINDNPNGRGNGDWVMTTNVNASSNIH